MTIAIPILWTIFCMGFGYGLAEAKHVWELERSGKWAALTFVFCCCGGFIYYAMK